MMWSFARFLVEKIGVACVPCSSFYRKGAAEAKRMVRFCYCKKEETLLEAGRRVDGFKEVAARVGIFATVS